MFYSWLQLSRRGEMKTIFFVINSEHSRDFFFRESGREIKNFPKFFLLLRCNKRSSVIKIKLWWSRGVRFPAGFHLKFHSWFPPKTLSFGFCLKSQFYVCFPPTMVLFSFLMNIIVINITGINLKASLICQITCLLGIARIWNEKENKFAIHFYLNSR